MFGILALAGAIFAVVIHGQSSQPSSLIRVTGIPSSITTPIANLMSLSPVPAASAPQFVLTDQHGLTRSLSSFKGDVIVLEFMDPHCVDICPIVSQEFIDANHDLGSSASRVVFMAINVNKYHAKISDMATFSAEHQLNTIPSWHFFTGSPTVLPPIWKAYGIDVVAPNPNADIIHSSLIFFIDSKGKQRFIADPTTDHTATGKAYLPAGVIASWGQGIALVARSLVK
jgi:protein SCO1/2